MRTLTLLVAVGFLGCESELPIRSPPGDGIHLRVAETSYQVEGSTDDELRAELRAKGPFDFAMQRAYATTTTELRWHWRKVEDADGCRPDVVLVDVEALEMLPEWRDQSHASAETVREWKGFLAALREHEGGHVEIGIEEGRDVGAVLGRPSTPLLGADLDAAPERDVVVR
jgi:predicted secreted Zn-dependent protease